MARRSPETFIKRQREMEKKMKAAEKRRRRQERKEHKSEAGTPAIPVLTPEPVFPEDGPQREVGAEVIAENPKPPGPAAEDRRESDGETDRA